MKGQGSYFLYILAVIVELGKLSLRWYLANVLFSYICENFSRATNFIGHCDVSSCYVGFVAEKLTFRVTPL